MDFSCPSCRKSIRSGFLRGGSFFRGLTGGTSNCDGYCPHCDAPLKKNLHEAEARTGAIVFPALILAAICVVFFVYVVQIWLVFLGISIVVAALVYEQWMTKARIPSDWRRWSLGSTDRVERKKALELSTILIATGVLWIFIAMAAIFIKWPIADWWGIGAVLIGLLSIALGVAKMGTRGK